LRSLKGLDRGNLDGREGAVIEVAFDAGECADELAVPNHEPYTPARHVVALRESEKFHRDIFRAWDFHDRGRAIAIEDQVGIGEVMEEIDLLGAAEGDDTFEEFARNGLRRGIRGKVKEKHLRPRTHRRQLVLQAIEKTVGIIHLNGHDLRASNGWTVNVDGVAGIRDKDGVLIIQRGEAKMGDSLFRSNGDDGLGIGVEFDSVAALIPVADGFTQSRNALGERVAMRGIARSSFDELGDDVGRCCTIGIAHAEVDDVFAATARLCFHLAGGVKDVWRQ
jgi:hypothetical protein